MSEYNRETIEAGIAWYEAMIVKLEKESGGGMASAETISYFRARILHWRGVLLSLDAASRLPEEKP